MYKQFIILFLFIITASNTDTVNFRKNTWIIEQTTLNTLYFKKGMTVDFVGSSIRFSDNNQSNKYPVIISDNRILIETGYTKWLFEIESTNSNLIFRELYTKNPLVISLIKVNTPKQYKS